MRMIREQSRLQRDATPLLPRDAHEGGGLRNCRRPHQHELVRANVEVMSYRLCHLSLLLADFHDRIQAPISWTDHLKHPLVLRSSFEKCGKIFVWIRVLHGGRVAALTVIDP